MAAYCALFSGWMAMSEDPIGFFRCVAVILAAWVALFAFLWVKSTNFDERQLNLIWGTQQEGERDG